MTLTVAQETQAREFLANLRKEISSHPGVGHSLLGRMIKDPRSKRDFKVLAGQHYPLVGNFCAYMEVLLINAPDSEAKCWLAKVLVAEYGERSDGEDHAEHYTKFMHAAGIEKGTEEDILLHPEVIDFIREHYRLVTEEPFLVGLGAVGPGHEWSIPGMFELAVAGLRKAGFEEAEIGYWTLHLEQDQDHGAWLEEALVKYCLTEENRAQIRKGAMLSLDARENFWWGVTDKINSDTTSRRLPASVSATAGSEDSQLTLKQLRESWTVQAKLVEK
ncbi:MAG: iron-containing redox enzyme family protein [Planctomycetes bacterium]|nr:iron-containing redox enzyme family protein [Planctomycetota bacterium]